jgi:diguanylate cyclase (GGDEF)-like protein/PAS domain S-box-containing protein
MSSPIRGGKAARPDASRREASREAAAERLFDELTRLAVEASKAPIAALSLVEGGHRWFKSRGGVSATETPRAIALSSEAILSRELLIFTDLWQEKRFAEETLGRSGIRFFAGAPLYASDGAPIGTLSVMDRSPRELGKVEREELQRLAEWASRELDVDVAYDTLTSRPRPAPAGPPAKPAAPASNPNGPPEPEFRHLVEGSPLGIYVIQDRRFQYANPGLAAILGYSREELLALETIEAAVAPEDRTTFLERLEKPARGVQPFFFRALKKDGDPIDVEVHDSATELSGAPAVMGTVLDVSYRKRSEAQIVEHAYVDPLTKLPNRVRFVDRLDLALAQARRYKRRLAIVYVDVDDFKFVNDNWGHSVGDMLLQSLALRLKRNLREVDTVARIGGDEFVILMPDLRQAEDMSAVAQKLLTVIGSPFNLDGRTIQLTSSVGIAAYPDDGDEAESLLHNADAAMYRAKAIGRNNYQLCTPELTASAVERLALQGGLRLALEKDEFLLHYQPLVSLISGRIVGFEALVRWQHPEKGLIMPGTFISVAEETGVILQLGEWVLRAACQQLKKWLETGLDLRMSVNFSARQFRERNLVEVVKRALADAGLESSRLEIEITESIAMEGAEIVVANLNALRGMGVRIAIDDFGTGYSSMSYLKRYPVTSLKIDRSFVTDLPTNNADAGIVRAIVEMAHGSSLSVTAEGVETKEQFIRLQQYGCDEMQGYWVARPLTTAGVDVRLSDEIKLWAQGN